MRSKTRRRALLVCTAAALALSGMLASSASALVVGVGDQNPETFSDPLYKALGVKRTRLTTPYNSITTQPAKLDAWITAALANGLEPHIAFTTPQLCASSRNCRPPSVAAYRSQMLKFRAKYPNLRVIAPWNEANSPTTSTYRYPRRAAEYYNTWRSLCSTCTLVAADLLDITNLPKYLATFKRYARGNPSIYGLHNYGDTNRFRSFGTRLILRETRGQIWLTETGGIVFFRTADGRVRLPASESRAARSYRYLLGKLVNIDRRRIRRVYTYNWKPVPSDRFDAGVLRNDGTPRESYRVLQAYRRLIR